MNRHSRDASSSRNALRDTGNEHPACSASLGAAEKPSAANGEGQVNSWSSNYRNAYLIQPLRHGRASLQTLGSGNRMRAWVTANQFVFNAANADASRTRSWVGEGGRPSAPVLLCGALFGDAEPRTSRCIGQLVA